MPRRRPHKYVPAHVAETQSTGRTIGATLPSRTRPGSQTWTSSHWVLTGGASMDVGGLYTSNWEIPGLWDVRDPVNPTGLSGADTFLAGRGYQNPTRSVDHPDGFYVPDGTDFVFGVQTASAVEFWNPVSYTAGEPEEYRIGTLRETADSANGREAAGIGYDDIFNEWWWAWRNPDNTVDIYRNREPFTTIPDSPNGRLIVTQNVVYYGGGGSVAALWRLNPYYSHVQEGLGFEPAKFNTPVLNDEYGFDIVWQDAAPSGGSVEFRPVLAGDANHNMPGLWCWKKEAGFAHAGTLTFWDGFGMGDVHQGMWYGHVYGGFNGKCFFVDEGGVDRCGDRRGFSRAAVYDDSSQGATYAELNYARETMTPQPFRLYVHPFWATYTDDAPYPNQGANTAWGTGPGEVGLRWSPARPPGLSSVPSGGWCVGPYGQGTRQLVVDGGYCATLEAHDFTGSDNFADNYGYTSQKIFMTLTDEETTVWLHAVCQVQQGMSSSNATLQKPHGMTFKINGIDFGPSPWSLQTAVEEGLMSDVVPGREIQGQNELGFDFWDFGTDAYEYSWSFTNTLSHSITVNLPPGDYTFQAKSNEQDIAMITVGGAHEMQFQAAIVDYDPDAEGYAATAGMSHGTYEVVRAIATDDQYIYALVGTDIGSGIEGWWGMEGHGINNFRVARIRIVAEFETPEMIEGRDFPTCLVTNDADFFSLVGVPNDSMCSDGSSLFYASAPGQSSFPTATTIYTCLLAKAAAQEVLYSATGIVKGLSYSYANDKLYFVVTTGGQTGLWSLDTDGTNATLEQAMTFAADAVHNNTTDPSFYTTEEMHAVTPMHGQVGCTTDGAVWFRTIDGDRYYMNRWHPDDGLSQTSSLSPWAVGSNTIPAGDQIISASGPTLAGFGDLMLHNSGAPAVYLYRYSGGQIRRDFTSAHSDLIWTDDYTYHAVTNTYDEVTGEYGGTIVNCHGFLHEANAFPGEDSWVRVWGPAAITGAVQPNPVGD